MKNIINYIANWCQYPREKDWSGTTLSLLSALEKQITVNNIDIHIPRIIRGLNKLFHLKLYFEEKGKGNNKLDYLLYTKKIKSALKNNKKTNLFISQDYGRMDFGGYIYQDLSVDSGFYAVNNYPDTKEFVGDLSDEKNNIAWKRNEQINNYNKIDGIFTMGMWQKKVLLEMSHIPENKVHHVGGGINIDASRIDYSQKRKNKILFVGRDFNRKGGAITIEGFKRLKKKMPEAELHILGGYNSETDKNQGIFFIGDVTPEQMSNFYNSCDIFCMPSYFEGYGLVFAEALTYGLPCIARNRFEMPYFIKPGKTGFLIENDYPQILADYMFELLTKPSYTKNVQEKKEFYLSEYSWDTVAKKILDVMLP